MKHLFLIYLTTFFTSQVCSTEAVVIVPQTAFYLNESESSEISEYRLKGNTIFVHGFHNTLKDYEGAEEEFINNEFKQTKFYKSIDKIGRQVYVKATDVFVYYGDRRELKQLE